VNDAMTAAPDTLALGLGALAEPSMPSPLRIAGAVLLVVALAVGALILARRMGPGAIRGGRSAEIAVVGRTVLDRKSALLLVEVDGRRILVGVTPQQLSSLSEWEEIPDPEVSVEEARQPVPDRFEAAMSRVLGRVRELEGVR